MLQDWSVRVHVRAVGRLGVLAARGHGCTSILLGKERLLVIGALIRLTERDFKVGLLLETASMASVDRVSLRLGTG